MTCSFRSLFAAAAAGLASFGAACAPADMGPVASNEVEVLARPADGLLDRMDLQAIVELELRRDAPGLAALLAHEDASVRARAAYALGSVQDTTVAPALLEALHDLDAGVRADAAFAVGQLPMSGVATPLFDILKVEWDPRARREQLEAVGKRCEGGAARRLFQIGDPDLLPGVARAMARCVLAGVEPDTLWSRLAADLSSPDPSVREWAAYAFGRHPDPQVWQRQRREVRQALREYAADDPAAMHLVRALGRARDRFSWDLVGWWLRNGALWETRANAAAALAGGDFSTPLGYLVPAMDDPSVHVRLSAMEGIGQVPPTAALATRLREWLVRNPDDLAGARLVLEILARAGEAEPLEEWFRRPDIHEDAVLLAGAYAAASLEGARGPELLALAAEEGTPRGARAAVRALVERWELARPYPLSHDSFRALFQRLLEAPDERVRALAREALAAPELGGTPAGEDAAHQGDEGGVDEEEAAAPRSRPVRGVDWAHLRSLGPRPRLHLLTERGEVVLELRAEEAPLTVDAITTTAAAGRFDGIPFHRVVPNFVAQGGDITLNGTRPGAGFVLRSEFTRIPYLRGVVGMASSGKDTETTQYFVTHSPQPHLDGGYTAFGWVVDGMSVVDALAPEDRVVRAWVTPGGR